VINDRDESLDLQRFMTGLSATARGVLRVESPNREMASGWLITDTLAIAPGFRAAAGEAFSCRFARGGKARKVNASVVYAPSPDRSQLPAVLRLSDKTRQPRSPALYLGKLVVEQPLILVHYPRGIQRARISFGRIVALEGAEILHDVGTQQGSAGAPLLAADTLAVLGMHVGSYSDRSANLAVSIGTILESLRESPVWDEIARFHNLADVAVAKRNLGTPTSVSSDAPRQSDPGLIAAALQWNIDPTALNESLIANLTPLIADPDAATWVLSGADRRRLLTSAGSLDALRKIYRPGRGSGTGQHAIERVLAGPPYEVHEIPDDELPYWLQATRWFRDVAPDLPAPTEISRELDYRRVRGQLIAVAGPHLWGREDEIALVSKWYADASAGPLMISGVGGVGKSALIARFALDQPIETILFWLDFDRADLAPDDAVSVLTLLINQLRSQLDTLEIPYPCPESWRESADQIVEALRRTDHAPILLVLDGFEIAQHAERHHEIWLVLDHLVSRLTNIRVIVSGRAPVAELEINGRRAVQLELIGLTDSAAREWLASGGVRGKRIVAIMLDAANGIPLALKLALRLYDIAGTVDFPAQLSKELVDGYLYQRILDRVIDPELRAVASDALVLRRLTPEVLAEVLYDSIPQGLDASEVFARLARETALVFPDPASVESNVHPFLRLRPELRAATLRLLENASAERVTEIDRRAVAWYRNQDVDNPGVAAELVYHLLRLGDVAAAQEVWRDAVAPWLVGAERDIPQAHAAARTWLHDRFNDNDALSLALWEHFAAGEIQGFLSRGISRNVESILSERSERTADSPLILYDAWQMWQSGNLVEARRLLGTRDFDGRSPFGRDRAVLAARLALEEGTPGEADAILARIDDHQLWLDWEQSELPALAVRASRLRLTIDIAKELELLHFVDRGVTLGLALQRGVVPGDVLLPRLARALDNAGTLQIDVAVSAESFEVPRDAATRQRFYRGLDRDRERRTERPVPAELRLAGRDDDIDWSSPNVVRSVAETMLPIRTDRDAQGLRVGAQLALLGVRRWQLASRDTFLLDVAGMAVGHEALGDPLAASVIGTLGCLGGYNISLVPQGSSHGALLSQTLSRATEMGLATVRSELSMRSDPLARDLMASDSSGPLGDSVFQLMQREPTSRDRQILQGPVQTALDALLVCLAGSDPLDMLLARVLGLPAMSGGPL
jgi:hypothetical protein